MKLTKFIKFAFAVTATLLPTIAPCAVSVAAFTLPEKYEDRFAENNIVFYDPCGGGGSGGGGGTPTTPSPSPSGSNCTKLSELRTAMWSAASEEDKKHFMYVVAGEDHSIAGVEGYMNQVISKHGTNGELHDWLNRQCPAFRGGRTCNGSHTITSEEQTWIDEALAGSNNINFAIGNATGGSSVGMGKITCVWDGTKCREDVDYDAQGGTGKCNVYSSSASFGECWGDEGETSWVNDMKSQCSGGDNGGGSGGGNTPTPANGDLSVIASAKNANENVFNVPTSSEWYAGWSDRNNDSMKRMLENYGDLAYQLERAIGAPWIAIIVQMRYEDPSSKCGKNNFWGNGCPPGTGVGGASINGANLGEGFQQYAQTLTNGYHDQARGISDPKTYLEKIGPTWVQGNINGPGYAQIAAMKNSVDALTAYVNTPEGQAIVATFGNYSGTPGSPNPSGGTTTDECGNVISNPGDGSGDSITGEDIAKYALKLAWPYQGGEDGGEKDKCDPDGSGSLVAYDGRYTNSVCNHNPKPAYKEALKNVWGESEANSGCHSSGGVCDCTRFTTTVIVDGGFDPEAKKSSSTELTNYLASDAAKDKWEKIDDHNNLQPGDVMVRSGHTFIWLGSMGGSWGNAAQASQGDTVAVVSNKNSYSDFTAYRLKPRGGSGSGAGEAAQVPYDQRLSYLFPSGSYPTSESEMRTYLETVSVPILNESGSETTMNITVHKKLAEEVKAVFQDMVNVGFKVKASSTGAFNWRHIAGSSNMSKHSYGIAVDLNWNDNPQSHSYYNSNKGSNPYTVTDQIIDIWHSHGFNWGGYFGSNFDPMHFSYLERGSLDPNPN